MAVVCGACAASALAAPDGAGLIDATQVAPFASPMAAVRALDETPAVLQDSRGETDGPTRPRLSLSRAPGEHVLRVGGLASNELRSLSYRWWLGHGRVAVGLGVGSVGYVVPVRGDFGAAATTVRGATPLASVGVRYALSPDAEVYADGARSQGLGGEPGVSYRTKAGLEWQPARSLPGLDGGRLGLQFDSGYRMALKPRKGGVAVYLRRDF